MAIVYSLQQEVANQIASGLISSENFQLSIFGTTKPSSTTSGVVVAIYEIGAFVGSASVMAFGE